MRIIFKLLNIIVHSATSIYRIKFLFGMWRHAVWRNVSKLSEESTASATTWKSKRNGDKFGTDIRGERTGKLSEPMEIGRTVKKRRIEENGPSRGSPLEDRVIGRNSLYNHCRENLRSRISLYTIKFVIMLSEFMEIHCTDGAGRNDSACRRIRQQSSLCRQFHENCLVKRASLNLCFVFSQYRMLW
jgi:hypothetical protein